MLHFTRRGAQSSELDPSLAHYSRTQYFTFRRQDDSACETSTTQKHPKPFTFQCATSHCKWDFGRELHVSPYPFEGLLQPNGE